MKKIIVYSFILFLPIVLLAQKSSDKKGVYKINDSFSISGNQIFYALPQNKVKIKINIRKTQIVQGPYAQYALKYLNISEGIVATDITYYELLNAKIKRYSVADSSNFYVINNIDEDNTPLISLMPNGVIVAYNKFVDVNIEDDKSYKLIKENNLNEEFVFTDLGVKPFVKEVSEKTYKKITTDTGIVKVPYKKLESRSITEEEKAKEAAAFIRKIRKRRAKLLFGMSQEVVESDSKSLQIRIKELNELEQAYLSLFMGKKIESEQSYSFDFYPSANNENEQVDICWFSERYGLKQSKKNLGKSAQPITLIVNKTNGLPKSHIKTFDASAKGGDFAYGLYYRIPAETMFTLKINNKILIRQIMAIAQKGEVMALPQSYMTDKFIIEFYPETGALKNIRKNY